MSWWDKNNLRLIQTNISELNANLDVDKNMEYLKELSANVLLLNTGGVESFYPTELEYQYQSPYLKKDLVGEMVKKCHDNNIKYMARFDFSKAHESIYKEHPEWFYKSIDNEIVNYNGMVHTCVNGYYQREYSLKIIEEVLNKYPVDGIFFNMFGYQTRDYSRNYYGICHCENCKKKFQDMYNFDLPKEEDIKDPVYQKYLIFKEITVKEMLDSIHGLVKSKNKEIAISTYAHHKIDIVKNESNTEPDRPLPHWLYSASENVKSVEDSWDDKLISNVCINAVSIDYRFMGVSKHQVAIRLYESIASGSGLDFCIIGDFDSYPESENFDTVKKISEFHRNNEKYYGNFKSISKVLLIKPEKFSDKKQELEYRGIFKILKEEHVLFDVIYQQNLNNKLEKIKKYSLILLPDLKNFANEKFLSEVESNEINLVATSYINNSETLNDFFDVKYLGEVENTRSAYLKIEDKDIFKRFKLRDWVFVKDEFTKIDFGESYKEYLTFISPARFGPPEKVGGHRETGYSGIGISKKNGNVIIPWHIGYLYYRYGYLDHKNILMDILDYALDNKYIIETNATENIEIFLDKYDKSSYILQLLNLSGFNGTSFHKPTQVNDINIKINNIKKAEKIFSLKDDKDINFELTKDGLSIMINKLTDYEAIIVNI